MRERRVARARLTLVRSGLPSDLLGHDAALAPADGGVVHGLTLVAPGGRIVLLLLLVPAREESRGLHVLKLIRDQGGGVGVVLNVVLKVPLVLDDVVDQAAKEDYVRAGPERRVDVAHRDRKSVV